MIEVIKFQQNKIALIIKMLKIENNNWWRTMNNLFFLIIISFQAKFIHSNPVWCETLCLSVFVVTEWNEIFLSSLVKFKIFQAESWKCMWKILFLTLKEVCGLKINNENFFLWYNYFSIIKNTGLLSIKVLSIPKKWMFDSLLYGHTWTLSINSTHILWPF